MRKFAEHRSQSVPSLSISNSTSAHRANSLVVTDVAPLLTSQKNNVLQGLIICAIDPDDTFDRTELNGCLGFIEGFQLIDTNDGGAYFAGTFRFFAGSKDAIHGKEYLWDEPSKKTFISFGSNGSDPFVRDLRTLFDNMGKPQAVVHLSCLSQNSPTNFLIHPYIYRAWRPRFQDWRNCCSAI